MERKMNNIAEEIINYQKDNDIPDTLLAFKLHFSVEELHNIKSMEKSPSQDEVNIIKEILG
ncbi:LBP_cg2779 family protein [Apilactobacillus apisilvae]|uniref:LBP_cg2779 family protein n=1 Tax=Apilactobacillus apisilvae TaxID=2923364 RepID=A0ABY4PFJ3_9LACO|nr:LBP_cg2779 family protein [Apilactobacillus apisilvae]UQS84415.1 LBP_cg2779 family protein [Apilactobacillus apisilvae]